MNNLQNNLPIGVFDSGIGGISVLGQMIKTLPDERFIFMADSGNAPYGTKSYEFVLAASVDAARKLYTSGIKALVVACNTATSVAINQIRQELSIPVIGMEPAVKPAAEKEHSGYIVVMATPLTLKEEKFNNLLKKYNSDDSIVPVPCPGLVELIESEAAPEKTASYLRETFHEFGTGDISTVVLGCTHYCFVKNQIRDVLGQSVRIVDGNEGTVRRLKAILESTGVQAACGEQADGDRVKFLTTGDPGVVIPLCKRFLERAITE